MRFIITEKSFYMEEGGALSEELQVWQEEFKRDKEYAWYLMGLKGCPPDADISMRFLSRVAESYFRCLTSLPELELSREKTEFFRDADTVSRLEAAVPFMIGAEYLDGKWIDRAFDGLHNIFQRGNCGIPRYGGNVSGGTEPTAACAGAYFLSPCGEQ